MSGAKSGEGGEGESNTVILRAFIANLGIAVAKFTAAIITGSAAMMTEGIHSTVDTLNQVFMWGGEKRAKKPPDELHPMGYARELYFWAFVVAVMIFALGAGVSAYEGIHTLINPHPTESPLIAFAVLGIAFLLEGWSWLTAWKAFNKHRGDLSVLEGIRQTKDTTSLVVLLEDSAAVTGVVLAAAGIGLELLTNNPVWDGVASLGIAGLLATVAVVLLREAKDLLIGESADPKLARTIRREVEEETGVIAVSDVFTVHLGPEQVFCVVTVDFDDAMPTGQLEKLVGRIEKKMIERNDFITRAYVHPLDEGDTLHQPQPQQQPA